MQRLVQIHLGTDTGEEGTITVGMQMIKNDETRNTPHVFLNLWQWDEIDHGDKRMYKGEIKRLTMSIISVNLVIMSFAPASHSSIVDLDQRSVPFS